MRYCDVSESGAVYPEGLNDEQNSVLDKAIGDSFAAYSKLLSLGVKKEDARAVLPIGTKTNIVVTMKAQYFKHFLEMRTTKHAQAEIKELAREMLQLAKDENSFFDWRIDN